MGYIVRFMRWPAGHRPGGDSIPEQWRMKTVLNRLAWGFAVTVVVYAAVGPGMGVLYGNPLACLGVGLIGLGLCMESRRKLIAVKAAQSQAPGRRD